MIDTLGTESLEMNADIFEISHLYRRRRELRLQSSSIDYLWRMSRLLGANFWYVAQLDSAPEVGFLIPRIPALTILGSGRHNVIETFYGSVDAEESEEWEFLCASSAEGNDEQQNITASEPSAGPEQQVVNGDSSTLTGRREEIAAASPRQLPEANQPGFERTEDWEVRYSSFFISGRSSIKTAKGSALRNPEPLKVYISCQYSTAKDPRSLCLQLC